MGTKTTKSKEKKEKISYKDLRNLNELFKDYNEKIEMAPNYMEFWQSSFQKFMELKKPQLEDQGLVKLVYGRIDDDYQNDHVFIYSCTAAYFSNLITGGSHTREQSFRDMIKGYIKNHLSKEKKTTDPEKYETFRKINEDKRFMELINEIENIIETNIT